MVTFGSVKEREYTLIEQGEYVLTLSDLEESEGNWGTRLVWKFLVAPKDDPTNYIANQNGDERTVWAFTDQDIILGSLAHEFVEKLTGKAYGKNDAPPDEDDLLGRRVLGYITHNTPTKGKNAGRKQEQIVTGSIKAFKGPQPNKVIAPNVTRPEPTEDEAERAELVSRLEKFIGRAVKMETPNHAAYVALDLSEGTNDQLRDLVAAVQAEVQDALDA
jgi:hypothetical protein